MTSTDAFECSAICIFHVSLLNFAHSSLYCAECVTYHFLCTAQLRRNSCILMFSIVQRLSKLHVRCQERIYNGCHFYVWTSYQLLSLNTINASFSNYSTCILFASSLQYLSCVLLTLHV